MRDSESSDTAEQDRIEIRIKGSEVKKTALLGLFAQMPFQGRNEFRCSGGCGKLVTVSDKKATKLRKMRKPKVTCNKCKKVRKARMKR